MGLFAAAVCVWSVADASSSSPLFSASPVTLPGGALDGEGVATGDFNLDGLQDVVVVTGPNARDVIFLQSTTGAWSKVELSRATTAHDVAVGDLNNDGRPDIYVGTSNAPDVFYLNTTSPGGTLSFSTNVTETAIDSRGVEISNFDDNVFADVAISTGAGESHWVFFNIANHEPVARELDTGDLDLNNGRDISVGDFNADGYTDVCIVTATSVDVVYLGSGGTTFVRDSSAGLNMVTPGVASVSGDFDGGHRGEDVMIICGQSAARDALITLGKPLLPFQPEAMKATFLSTNAPASSVRVHAATGDFNADGEDDVVVVADGQNGFLYLNDVANADEFTETKFVNGGSIPGTASAHAVAAVDLDGDQDLDLIIAADGAAPFILFNLLYAPEPPDTDGDGTPDSEDLDDDGDGMPDSWEIDFGTNPLDDDADQDLDGDGASNLDEFVAGSDPLEPGDYPALVCYVEAGELKLYFETASANAPCYETRERWYIVEVNSPGSDSWVEVWSDKTLVDGVQEVPVSTDGTLPRLHRLRIELRLPSAS